MTQEILTVKCHHAVSLEISLTESGEIMMCEPYDPEDTNWFSVVISRSDWEHMKAFIDRQFSTTPKS